MLLLVDVVQVRIFSGWDVERQELKYCCYDVGDA